MALTAYFPLDPYSYRPVETREVFTPELAAGRYVYVQEVDGTVWVAPDGNHMHPKILGRARPVVGAGELKVGPLGEVLEVNNLSGTFRCHPRSLLTVVGGLVQQGGLVTADVIKPYDEV